MSSQGSLMGKFIPPLPPKRFEEKNKLKLNLTADEKPSKGLNGGLNGEWKRSSKKSITSSNRSQQTLDC